ncbi:hypothetical protein SISNIDRAFT_494386 [Sistotremastrum niveocremeum HHB9708]|uniref:ABM domain-containing protein n=1 Tax=Sistotremastrum niveocremeum HHB9708 TaxID=1314777 RepID=A0A164WYP3_9AGAM|nr:hypothetical protein SISNIDRAFT_494386 [Sistotremastrum niveocremeum HHB9708]
MSAITKIFVLDLNDATKADPSSFEEVVNLVHEKKEELGVKKQYWGVPVEDAGKLYWTLEYTSSTPPPLTTPILTALSSHSTTQKSVSLSFPPSKPGSPSLQTPLTEIAIFAISASTDRQIFTEHVEKLIEAGLGFPGCENGSWIWTEEDGRQAVLVAGWTGMEAYLGFVQTAEFGAIAGILIPMTSERSMAHLALKSKE